MGKPAFNPGFRLSLRDVIVLLIGIIAAGGLAFVAPPVSLVVGATVLHFFLFCNVFRIRRGPELIWAAAFLGLSLAAMHWGLAWPIALLAGFGVAAVLIVNEFRHPSYHGVGWRRLNPSLPEWWSRRGRAEGSAIVR